MQRMFSIHADPRIYIVSLIHGKNGGPCVPDPRRPARCLADLNELICYLASNTDTHGYADPARWTNSIIDNQNLTGTDVRVTSDWEYTCDETLQRVWVTHRDFRCIRICDADGRIIDARKYWDAVVRAVRAGVNRWYFPGRRHSRWNGFKSHKVQRWRGRKARSGAFVRLAFEICDDEGLGIVRGNMLRSAMLNTAREMIDWDFNDIRAAGSSGWKSRKHRHQWEHRVVEAERHAANRLRRAMRDGGQLWPET